MFISFEGIDGSGKTTQINLLSEELRARGHSVCRVREPGGTQLGEAIRSLLLHPDGDVCPRSELLLFSAARAQLVDRIIKPALARSEVVIADRFFDSTTAYQGGGRGVASDDFLSAFHSFVVDGCVPDRTYLLRLAPEIASARAAQRATKDRMEQSGDDFYARVAAAYDSLATAEPDRILSLDASLDPQSLSKQILDDVLARIA